MRYPARPTTPCLVSEVLQPFPEGRDTGLSFGILLREVHEYSNTPHTVTLLRAHRKRPGGCRAAENRDELAPCHVGVGGLFAIIHWIKGAYSMSRRCRPKLICRHWRGFGEAALSHYPNRAIAIQEAKIFAIMGPR